MASIKQMQTKSGKRFFEISVSRGHGVTRYTKRWYWPDGWARSTVERKVKAVAAEFERACNAGEIENRAQKKERIASIAAESAKLKTVRQYVDGVYMPKKELSFSENARSNYRMFLDKHIYPVIGDMLLIDVTPAIIQKMLTDFQRAGYAYSSSVKLYNILNGVFKMAAKDDSISYSPMFKVDRPKQPKESEVVIDESEKAYTPKELAFIMDCIKQAPLKWQAYINLAADTGARRGELCGLQWPDIDWNTGTVTIKRNLQYTPDKGIYTTTPKNRKTRSVDIGQETLEILHKLRDEQAATCISQWVFTQDGLPVPMNPQSPTRYFARFGKRYGIKDFHPHKLRHTSASIAITNGADVVSVSERLGHSDSSVTLKMYAHANDESIRRAGQIVRDILKAQNE